MKQFLAFVQKEFFHIFRDVRTMMILLLMPVILIILFGFAITNDIRHCPVTVFDQSRDEITTRMTSQLDASEYFTVMDVVFSYEEVQTLFRKNKIRMAVVFPPLYASTDGAKIQLLVDSSDPNEATSLIQYASTILSTSTFDVQQLDRAGRGGVFPIVHLLYNPQMKAAYNFVPGVMGLILMLICALMTSVGIVKEKESGTMEILLVSPMRPFYIIVAKGIPYLLLSLVNIATILLLSRYLLDVPVEGNIFLLFFLSTLYSIVALCLGLLISTVADTQQAAMLISGMALMLPVMLLSDMIFPIDSMPAILRYFSYIVPARWYISAVKDVMIKGLGFGAISTDLLILTGMAVLLVILSLKRFKIRLE